MSWTDFSWFLFQNFWNLKWFSVPILWLLGASISYSKWSPESHWIFLDSMDPIVYGRGVKIFIEDRSFPSLQGSVFSEVYIVLGRKSSSESCRGGHHLTTCSISRYSICSDKASRSSFASGFCAVRVRAWICSSLRKKSEEETIRLNRTTGKRAVGWSVSQPAFKWSTNECPPNATELEIIRSSSRWTTTTASCDRYRFLYWILLLTTLSIPYLFT